MNRFIIENRSCLDWRSALDLVKKVVEQGRISDDGKQFCYATTFTGVDTEGLSRRFCVWTHRNKSSDRFVVEDNYDADAEINLKMEPDK